MKETGREERSRGTLLGSIERLSDSAQCHPGHHSPGLGVEKGAPHPPHFSGSLWALT